MHYLTWIWNARIIGRNTYEFRARKNRCWQTESSDRCQLQAKKSQWYPDVTTIDGPACSELAKSQPIMMHTISAHITTTENMIAIMRWPQLYSKWSNANAEKCSFSIAKASRHQPLYLFPCKTRRRAFGCSCRLWTNQLVCGHKKHETSTHIHINFYSFSSIRYSVKMI